MVRPPTSSRMQSMSTSSSVDPCLLEQHLPRYTFGHRYDIVVDNGCLDTVYEVARNVDLSRSSVIPFLFRLRGLPTRQLRAREFTRAMGWTDLGEERPSEFLIGYWKSDRVERVDDPRLFAREMPGIRQKVAFSFRFHALNPGQVRVETETRVQCIGRAAKLSFWVYWVAIRPFSGRVRTEVLRLIKQQAEERAREPAAGTPLAAADAAGGEARPSPPRLAMVVKVPMPVLLAMRGYYRTLGRLSPRLAVNSFQRMMTGMPPGRMSQADRAFVATSRRLSIACEGATLVGHEFGHGPTVLLVHGLMGNSGNFRAMVPPLVAQGYRVVAVDFVNHGLSPRGPSLSAQTIRQMQQIIASQGRVHAVVSHSAGCYLTAMAMRDAETRSRIGRCVYIAPYPSMEATLRTFMGHFHVPDKVLPDLMRWMGELIGVPCEQQTLVACLPRHGAPGQPASLFVHDADDDHIALAGTSDVVRRLAGPPLHVTRGLGHFKVLKDAQVIARIASFLN